MSAKKFGDWGKVITDLNLQVQKGVKLRDFVLSESARKFQDGIRNEIMRDQVQPQDRKFSAQEYADVVKIEKRGSSTFIGVMGGEVLHGQDVVSWATFAELGLYETRFMGVWRRFMERFGKKFKQEIEAIQAGKI